LALLTTVWIP